MEVLDDACFFGLEQEHLAEEIASLTARTQAPGKTFSEEAVKRELGWDEEAGDTFTPQEEKYRAQAEAAAQKISDYSKQAAIDKILQSLADWPVEVSSEWRTDSRVPKRGAAFLHL